MGIGATGGASNYSVIHRFESVSALYFNNKNYYSTGEKLIEFFLR